MRKGFTLIELMIVVAIIAVIAAIAIPNLVASKMASNETAAIGGCKTYLAAQSQFHRAAYYAAATALVYANPTDGTGFPDLYECEGTLLRLIDQAFSQAAVNGDNTARAGYLFDDLVYGDYTVDCGLGAAPAVYDRSGRNIFVVDITGTVYQKLGVADCVPETAYPADLSDWIPAGSN